MYQSPTLAALSVAGVYAFLLTCVGIALLGLVLHMLFKAWRGNHDHAFNQVKVIVIACVVVALAGSIATMSALGNDILGFFGA